MREGEEGEEGEEEEEGEEGEREMGIVECLLIFFFLSLSLSLLSSIETTGPH